MNEYKFHIGDYRRDAGHLTVEEHGIYRYLIDELFLQETPLLPDISLLSRKMRLTSDQKPLLEQILAEFFELTDEGYTHPRVLRELSRIYDVSAQARANIKKRWDRKNGNTPVKKNDTPVLRPNNDSNTGDILPSNPVTQKPNNPQKKGSAKKRSNGRFKPPTPDQVQTYIDEKNYQGFTGETFCDFYIARNWQLSHGKQMSDWKAAVRTWNNRRNDDQPPQTNKWETGL